jgi:hypothetical protein
MRDTIDMAREAGIIDPRDAFSEEHVQAVLEDLKRFAALVRADEREACAKVCEALVPDMSRTANDASVWDVATFDCAEAIRARGNT